MRHEAHGTAASAVSGRSAAASPRPVPPPASGRPLMLATEITSGIARTRASTSLVVWTIRPSGYDPGMLTVASSR